MSFSPAKNDLEQVSTMTGQLPGASTTNTEATPKTPRQQTSGNKKVSKPTTPKSKKRTPKAKKEASGDNDGTLKIFAPKKRATAVDPGEDEENTPTKKHAAKTKAATSNYPTSPADLSSADRLMLEMKRDGKPWAEINTAYTNFTGINLAKGSLASRYAKIMDALMEWKDGDVERMLYLKEKIEKETEEAIAAFRKKAESEIWSSIAKAMEGIGGDPYTAGCVEKAFNKEKKDGFPHRATIHEVIARSASAGNANAGDGSDADDNDSHGRG